ncbi:thioredoxin family protein [Niveibacterium umoris]
MSWFNGGVDAAFAEAARTNKPVFLYWGAEWCPYCNQVKATLFNRADFAERAKQFIPVELDGDSADGQKLASRFKVSGYPTMILFRPDGTELTRLPGEVDPQHYLQVLALGMNAGRPVKEVLAAALAGRPTTADDWRLLAYYPFDADEEQLVRKAALPATLAQLAASVPPAESALATRLALKAFIAQAQMTPQPTLASDAGAQLIEKLLADAAEARSLFDLLIIDPDKVVPLVTPSGGAARRALAQQWSQALERLTQDATLSTTDRLSALGARVALGKLEGATPVEPAQLRKQIQAADAATNNGFERQSVIYTAAGVLTDAGLLDDSDALLKAELKRSHAPYYFMRMLGGNAKKRGDTAAALKWYEDAWAASHGGATRLQWGTGYLNGLLDLTPDDAVRIEAAATRLLDEVASTPDAFYLRNRTALERSAKKLAAWHATGKHTASHAAIAAKARAVCKGLPSGDPQRPVCDAIAKTMG